MATPIATQLSQLNGIATKVLADSGASLKVALFVNGSEVNHASYARQTVSTFNAATAYASNRSARTRSASVTFGSNNGLITFDQIKVYASDGTTLIDATERSTPRTNDGPVTIIFRTPAAKLEFDIVDYGAACDGTTDDTDAWELAIAAADAYDGVVLHPGGTSCISSGLVVPVDSVIGIRGVPGSAIKAIGSAFGPMITRESTVGGQGALYGYIRDIRLDGNDIATIGLRVQTVQQHYENITINRCTRAGLYNAGGQNNTFTSCNIEDNGTTGVVGGSVLWPDGNYVLDLGARNNAHIRCQIGALYGTPANRGKYNIVFCQSEVSAIAGGEPPSSNFFYGCQIERRSASHLACILHTAGQFNRFTDCTIQQLTTPAVIINDTDGYESKTLTFTNCTFSGDYAVVRANHGSSGSVDRPSVIFCGATICEPFTTRLFEVGDNSEIEVAGPIYHGATNIGEVYGGGSKTIHGLVVQRMLSLPGTPNDSTGVPSSYNNQAPVSYNSTSQKVSAYQGSWRAVTLS